MTNNHIIQLLIIVIKENTMNNTHFKPAFTLAETLITISIIGIIAAMTLPTLITNAQKEATASQLKKFYNTINNALQFAKADHGDVEYWMGTPKDLTYEENLDFMKTYILPYIKYNRYDNCFENAVCIYMTAGGMFAFRYDKNGGDIFYFINGKYNPDASINEKIRNVFAFQFNKINGYDTDGNKMENKGIKTTVEPYSMNWDGTYNDLIYNNGRGCNKMSSKRSTFCTKLIQMNDWKITKDYPW